jgi:hypothetical protein
MRALDARGISASASAAALCASLAATAAFGAQGGAAPPDFGPNPNVSWIAYSNNFIAPPKGPGPVDNPPDRPYAVGRVPDPYVPESPAFERARLAAEPANATRTRIADLSNPILRPWVRAALKQVNEDTLAGRLLYNRQVSCWPIGTPGFLLYPVQPVFIVQDLKEVLMTWQNDHQVRHIYLDVPHRAHFTPSWYGDSIGHYEGDALVVDTIGITTKTFLDNYRTPHSAQLHTVERFHLVGGGKTLQVDLHVEDPVAFTTPWNAIQRYRRVEPGPMIETACAENNINPFHQPLEPMPEADTPDF